MNPQQKFDELFRDPIYLALKDHLYNYLRRKDEISRFLHHEGGLILEIGSGSSPVTPMTEDVIYSDVSIEALRHLRSVRSADRTVALSVTEIPFREDSVSLVVCSEVIEHIEDDEKALQEMHRVLEPGGTLILTVPLHEYYFALDDSFVGHKRRYEVPDLLGCLERAGFSKFTTAKIAGPLEKLTTMAAVVVFKVFAVRRAPSTSTRLTFLLRGLLPIYKRVNWFYAQLIKLEGKVMPLSLSTILLVHCRKG